MQLPDPWASKVNLFQKLTLTRYLWPDQVGKAFLDPFTFELLVFPPISSICRSDLVE